MLLLVALGLLGLVSANYVDGDVLYVEEDQPRVVSWMVNDEENEIDVDGGEPRKMSRRKRSALRYSGNELPDSQNNKDGLLFREIQPSTCQEKLKSLCGVGDREVDDLFYLECVQTFKVCLFLLTNSSSNRGNLILELKELIAKKTQFIQCS